MSAQYLLPCSCGQKLRVTVSQAGEQVACACGKHLSVPTLRGIRQLEPAAAAPVQAVPGWSRVHGAFFAGGLVVICLGLALLAYNGFYYSQLGAYTTDRSADVIKEFAGQLDQITPSDALDLWRTEILEHGLGDPHEPPWVTAKNRRSELLRWIQVGGAALGLGVLMAAGALFIGRR